MESTINQTAYLSKEILGTYSDIRKRVEFAVQDAGFGIVTELDMEQKLKDKLDNVELGTYKILGICNPALAYEALKVEENIGVFLPCKIIIKQKEEALFEVASFNPSTMMGALNNPELDKIADKVTSRLRKLIENL